jgi:hypothetical protein
LRREVARETRDAAAVDSNINGATIVRDREYKAHGNTDIADALVDANPNRFQVVPQDEWVKGVDDSSARQKPLSSPHPLAGEGSGVRAGFRDALRRADRTTAPTGAGA